MAMKRRDFNRLVLAGAGISPRSLRDRRSLNCGRGSQLKPRAPENRMDSKQERSS